MKSSISEAYDRAVLSVIYIKLQAGEGGFTKAVMMLFGAVMFLIGATIVLPAFFGYHFGSSGFSPFD